MAWWNRGKKSLSVAGAEVYPDGTMFYPIRSDSVNFGTSTVEDQRLAYQRCAPVTSIIGRLVSGHLSRKCYLQNAEGVEVKTAQANKLRTLINRPNPFQDGKKFEANAITYLRLFGECFILTPTSDNRDPMTARLMWVLPNWVVRPVYTGKVFMQTSIEEIQTGWEMYVGGGWVSIPLSDILRIQDSYINVGTLNGAGITSFLDGQSRLGALNDQINLIIKAYEANTELVVNHGAMGVISPKTSGTGATSNVPITHKERESLQKDFMKYGVTRGKWKYILSNIALDFSQISANVADLQLIPSIKESVRQIAECYGVPMELLGYPEGTTFTNLSEAKKSMYESEVIPCATTYTEAFANHFQLGRWGIYYNMYFDHLEMFQKSKQDYASALKTFNEAKKIEFDNGLISIQEWREQLIQFES